jgi:hypothetical protein
MDFDRLCHKSCIKTGYLNMLLLGGIAMKVVSVALSGAALLMSAAALALSIIALVHKS